MLESPEKLDAGPAAPSPQQSAADLDSAVKSIVLKEFKFWWTDNNQGRRAGDAVSRMWNAYPFGALLMDESWAWWSVDQVMRDGQWQARQVGSLHGLVLATSVQSVAVLDWPEGATKTSKIIVVPYKNHAGLQGEKPQESIFDSGAARVFYAEEFFQAQGFDQSDFVLSCAYVPRELTRSVQWQARRDGHHMGACAGAGPNAGTAAVGHTFALVSATSASMPSHAAAAGMPSVSGYRSRRAVTGNTRGVLSRSQDRQQCA